MSALGESTALSFFSAAETSRWRQRREEESKKKTPTLPVSYSLSEP